MSVSATMTNPGEERLRVRLAYGRRTAGIGIAVSGTNFDGGSLVDIEWTRSPRNVLAERGYGPVTVCSLKLRARARSSARTLLAQHLKTHGDHGRHAS